MLGIVQHPDYQIGRPVKFFLQSLFFGTVEHLASPRSLAGRLIERAATGMAMKATAGITPNLPNRIIPKEVKPTVVNYVVEEHVTPKTTAAKSHWASLSDKARQSMTTATLQGISGYKRHLDFRFQTPQDKSQWISFAMPKGKFPGPGEKVQIIQSTAQHGNAPYNPPIIESGYGQGLTRVVMEGKALVWTDRQMFHLIIDRIDYPFVIVPSDHWKEGLLIGKNLRAPPYYDRPWRMVDVTDDKEARNSFMNDDKFIAQKKYDGGHYRLIVDRNKTMLISRRPHTGEGEVGVDRIYNMPELLNLKGVKSANVAVEVYSTNKGPYRAPHAYATALLNSNPVRCAELKSEHGNLRVVMLDVLEYNGTSMEGVPYNSKLVVMKGIHKDNSVLEVPITKFDAKGKLALRQKLYDANLEGVTYRNAVDPDPMVVYKDKFKQTWDFKIIDVVPVKPVSLSSKWLHKEGGGVFILEGGQPVKITTDWMKEDAGKHPENYIGRYAVVKGMSYDTVSGRVRAPVLVGIHHDK